MLESIFAHVVDYRILNDGCWVLQIGKISHELFKGQWFGNSLIVDFIHFFGLYYLT